MLTKVFKTGRIAQTRSFVYAGNQDIPSIFSDFKNHGFLPSEKPLKELPSQFKDLNEILDKMTLKQKDGSQGLLAKDLLRKTVDNDFSDLLSEVQKIDPLDARMNTALFRDYSMLTSSYLLESCHLSYLKTKNYGEGMSKIPAKLAVPLKLLADRLYYK
jgi:indoleamine 2,3-dioxygenase